MEAEKTTGLAKVTSFGRKAAVGGSLLAFSSFAMAEGIDTSEITSAFADLTGAISTVGGLIIGAAALAITFKWVKGMIFS